jgi:ribulose 1,5-bisphosphate synthetase/thiazole synthase
MSANAYLGGQRMVPIFGGMLLLQKSWQNSIAESLILWAEHSAPT